MKDYHTRNRLYGIDNLSLEQNNENGHAQKVDMELDYLSFPGFSKGRELEEKSLIILIRMSIYSNFKTINFTN